MDRKRENDSALVRARYDSPVGMLVLTAGPAGLTGLWREEYCQYPPKFPGREIREAELPEISEKTEDIAGPEGILAAAVSWLDRYFDGESVSAEGFPLAASGSAFQREVWKIVRDIPYGTLMTYGEIARILAERRGIRKMAAQAVGGAVGHNPISIIVPCHRVVGTNGNLTGYGGSMWVKKWLLAHEGIDLKGFYDPEERVWIV